MAERIYKNQHFLINSHVAENMVSFANIEPDETVLEIGPGKGFITQFIAESAKKVIVIEKDPNLEKEMQEIAGKYNNVEIIIGDALSRRWPKGIDKIVANIPFNITEPLFNRLYFERFKLALLLVGERHASNVQDYKLKNLEETTPSRLAILTNAFFDTEYYMQVPSSDFSPEPSVNGALLSLKPSKKGSLDFRDYLFRSVWEQRKRPLRSSVANGTANYLSLEGDICYLNEGRITTILSLPEDLIDKRGMDLANSDFLEIYKCLSNKKSKKRLYKTNRNLSEGYRY